MLIFVFSYCGFHTFKTKLYCSLKSEVEYHLLLTRRCCLFSERLLRCALHCCCCCCHCYSCGCCGGCGKLCKLVNKSGPAYTKRQRQRRVNAGMTSAILISLKTTESLQNGITMHSRVTPLFSLRAKSLLSLQS